MLELGEDKVLFGEKKNFSLAVRLDIFSNDEDVPHGYENSWGDLEFWIDGINITDQIYYSNSGEINITHIRWWLSPIFVWFLDNWQPIFHEQYFPMEGFGQKNARDVYYEAWERWGGEDDFEKWQEWGERHSLRFASNGGFCPDLFMRRMADDIEFSWGEKVRPGGQDVRFVAEGGSAYIPAIKVAKVFFEFFRFVYNQCLDAGIDQIWIRKIKKYLDMVSNNDPSFVTKRFREDVCWFFDGTSQGGKRAEKFFETLKESNGYNIACTNNMDYSIIPIIAPEVALFGTLSPNISYEDAAVLLGLWNTVSNEKICNNNYCNEIIKYLSPEPAWCVPYAYQDGYNLALDFLEYREESRGLSKIDIIKIVNDIGIDIIYQDLKEDAPPGVAFAPAWNKNDTDSFKPTIIVNNYHVRAKNKAGERFIVAHELAHLLFDRERAKPLAMGSGKWVHESVERRANAFAAMILAPTWLLEKEIKKEGTYGLHHMQADKLRDFISILIDKLEVNWSMILHHLKNLHFISENQYNNLINFSLS